MIVDGRTVNENSISRRPTVLGSTSIEQTRVRTQIGYDCRVQSVTIWINGLVGTLVIYPLAGLCVMVSIVFPIVPTTSLFVGLGALNANGGHPRFWGLILSMAIGSWVGDMLLYSLSRKIDFATWKLFSNPAAQDTIASMNRKVADAGLVLTLMSRFIPLGRTIIAIVAGSGGVRPTNFVWFSAAASALWAFYSVGFGWLTANWMDVPSLVSAVIAIIFSIVLGLVISYFASLWLNRKPKASGTEAAPAES